MTEPNDSRLSRRVPSVDYLRSENAYKQRGRFPVHGGAEAF
jgi:hypothetical protein